MRSELQEDLRASGDFPAVRGRHLRCKCLSSEYGVDECVAALSGGAAPLTFLPQRKELAPAVALITPGLRSVAQSGSASGLGPEGRRFESSRSDHLPSGQIPCKHCRMARKCSPFTLGNPCFSFWVIPDKAGQIPTFRGGSEVAWVARGLKATVSRLEGARRTHGQQPIETHPNRRDTADP